MEFREFQVFTYSLSCYIWSEILCSISVIVIIPGLVVFPFFFFHFLKTQSSFSLSLLSVIVGDAAATLLRHTERFCLKTDLHVET